MIKLVARASALMHPAFWVLVGMGTVLAIVQAVHGDWFYMLDTLMTVGTTIIIGIQAREIERLRAAKPEPVGFN